MKACCPGRVFTTVYMGTVNSSKETQQRAQRLADQIGADHLDVKIDAVVDAMAKLFATITGFTPQFRVCASLQLTTVKRQEHGRLQGALGCLVCRQKAVLEEGAGGRAGVHPCSWSSVS